MTGSAQRFVSSLPWKLPIMWQGKSGIWKLDEDRIATIALSVRGTHDHYKGVLVEITSKTKGPIKTKWFGFDEYLTARSDTRIDYKGGFEVIAYCGWEWYIAEPAHPELFTKAVERWLHSWE